jgi:hypothetical protein
VQTPQRIEHILVKQQPSKESERLLMLVVNGRVNDVIGLDATRRVTAHVVIARHENNPFLRDIKSVH